MDAILLSKNLELINKIKKTADGKLNLTILNSLDDVFNYFDTNNSNDMLLIDYDSFSISDISKLFNIFNFNFIPLIIFKTFNEQLITRLLSHYLFTFYVLTNDNVKEFILHVFTIITNCMQNTLSMNEFYFIDISSSIKYNDNLIKFTKLEYSLLKYLYLHKNHLVTRNELLQRIWGFEEDDYFSRAIDTHIKSIRKKLLFFPNKKIEIITSRGKGYYLKIKKE